MKFLIVDDVESILFMTTAMLNMLNPSFEVKTAMNAKEAIAMIENERFDVVISDYDMPGGNGGELFAHVRRHHNNIRFILSSSWLPSELDEFRGCADQLSAHLTKPYTRADFMAAIKKTLEDK